MSFHLEVGEPDFQMPPAAREAACQALDQGLTHYTHSLGDLELREAICEHYQKTYGAHVDPKQVVVTSGTSPAIMLAFAALLERDDEVILSDPDMPATPTSSASWRSGRSEFPSTRRMAMRERSTRFLT